MEQSPQYVIEMLHITKEFPGIKANDDITLQLRKGEIHALLGENGAGKSTLMSVLFGLYQPEEGEIRKNGKPVKINDPNDATALGIGMVHQHFKLVDNYTVAENIVLGIEPMKKLLGFLPCVDIKTANRQIEELSKRYGLEVNPTDKIEDLPVSVRQRVEILKMLYREADILIFDEPTAVLTPQEIDFLLKIIGELRKNGKTIILITHKIEEIKKIADRCAILHRGQLVDVLDVQSTSSQEMANLMVGRQVMFSANKAAPKFRDTVLEVEHLTVRNAQKLDVVKDVSFKIRGGEIFAIAGVSGNGQGELADAIAGMVKTHSGTIRLGGTDITDYSIRQRVEAGLSYIPEDRQGVGVFMDLTLSQNLALRRYYREPFSKNGILDFSQFDRYAENLIENYDIRSGQGPVTMARSMSGGNQQKAIVAREIDKDPELLVAVQPTRGLDVGAIENVHKELVAQRDAGKAVLLVSLELDEVMDVPDRILVMYEGEIVGELDPKATTQEELGLYMAGAKRDEVRE